jgi:hypothetical protein
MLQCSITLRRPLVYFKANSSRYNDVASLLCFLRVTERCDLVRKHQLRGLGKPITTRPSRTGTARVEAARAGLRAPKRLRIAEISAHQGDAYPRIDFPPRFDPAESRVEALL